jgi:hypothetical protein
MTTFEKLWQQHDQLKGVTTLLDKSFIDEVVVPATSVSESVHTLMAALKNDEELYLSYKSSIAMCFYDECEKQLGHANGVNKEFVHKVANEAAIKFLDKFIA